MDKAPENENQYQALLDQAWNALGAGRGEVALELCDEALRMTTPRSDAFYVRGCILWELGREVEALDDFDRCLKLGGDYYAAMLVKAASLLQNEPEEAVALCNQALARNPDEEYEAWAYVLKTDALAATGKLGEALSVAGQGLSTIREYAPLYVRRAWILYRLARFTEAKEALDAACALAPDDAFALNLRGKVYQRLGQTGAAGRDFARAARLDPARYRLPVRMSAGEFERLVQKAVLGIPPYFRRQLKDVQMSVTDFLPEDGIRQGLDPDIKGLYQGVTVHEQHRTSLPGKIILFQRSIENVCGNLGELARVIQETICHEVGHHFGLSEEELSRLERGSPPVPERGPQRDYPAHSE